MGKKISSSCANLFPTVHLDMYQPKLKKLKSSTTKKYEMYVILPRKYW